MTTKVRYIGSKDVVQLAIAGALLTFPQGTWVDPVAAAEAANVPGIHALIACRGLVDHPNWEIDGDLDDPAPAKKTKRRRPPKPKASAQEDPTTAADPATGEAAAEE